MKGIDYYPEQWPIEMIERDLDRIVALGADAIRIAEFAWHIIEPEDGQFDFSYFDDVIDKAKSRGLKIVYGTPSATFPQWLRPYFDDILIVDQYGHQVSPGGRRLYCYNSPTYRRYTKRMVEALLKHYRNEQSIVAWQIDNEIGHEGSDVCFCEHCRAGFERFLERKYRDIIVLNQIYGSDFWTLKYRDFGDVPMPRPTITLHNPSLVLDWYQFRSQSIQTFLNEQIEMVRLFKAAHQLITHNFFGGFFDVACNQQQIAKDLDVVSFDNYPTWGGMESALSDYQIAFNLDYIRGLKGAEFWVLEQLIGAQGHRLIGYTPPVEQVVVWSKQAVLRGASSLFYFRYRTNPKAQEQLCQGIYDVADVENNKTATVRELFSWMDYFKAQKDERQKAKVAIVWDYDNRWSWHFQPQSNGFDYRAELDKLYQSFYDLAINVDILSFDSDWSTYQCVVFAHFQFVDSKRATAIAEFIKSGGTVLMTYRSALRDNYNNIHFAEEFPYHLTDVFGVSVRSFESLGQTQSKMLYQSETCVGQATVWCDYLELFRARSLLEYDNGMTAFSKSNYGQGNAYYLATSPDSMLLKNEMRRLLCDIGISVYDKPDNLEVIHYHGGSYLLNHSNQQIDWRGFAIKPYQVRFEKLE